MSPTFEGVLRQARALPSEERRRLIEVLSKPNGRKELIKKWDDDPVIKALRALVDTIESSIDPEISASIRTAEQIRKMNDRGFAL